MDAASLSWRSRALSSACWAWSCAPASSLAASATRRLYSPMRRWPASFCVGLLGSTRSIRSSDRPSNGSEEDKSGNGVVLRCRDKSLREFDHGPFQRHASDDRPRMAFVQRVALEGVLLVVADDVDHGIAAFGDGTFAQNLQRRHHRPSAGLFVRSSDRKSVV